MSQDQACDQQNSSTFPLRWRLLSRPSDLCSQVRLSYWPAALRISQQGEKYSSRKACFSPSSFFSTSSGRWKLPLESWGEDFQARRAMREIQIYQIPVWQLLSWAVLKLFHSPMSRYYFVHASPPPSCQGDLHLAWHCKKHKRDKETRVTGPKVLWGWTVSKQERAHRKNDTNTINNSLQRLSKRTLT